MKAKDLVIDKHYNYTRPSSGQVFEVVYLGVLPKGRAYVGYHDFESVNGDFIGCVSSDEVIEAEISEVPSKSKYDRGQVIAGIGLLVILGVTIVLAIITNA